MKVSFVVIICFFSSIVSVSGAQNKTAWGKVVDWCSGAASDIVVWSRGASESITKFSNDVVDEAKKLILLSVSALPEQHAHSRERRDVLESIKGAWDEVVKTLTHAGENVVYVFRPTEKSTVDKIVDELKATFT